MSFDYELDNKAKELGIKYYKNCRMRDELKGKINYKECGIVNLESSEEQGSHWICYYKDGNNKYVFDSYGADPPLELQKYLSGKSNPKDIICFSTYDGKYPDQPLQSFNSKICGELCLIVLWLLDRGYSFSKIIDIINEYC